MYKIPRASCGKKTDELKSKMYNLFLVMYKN